jgi:hypothetical protein
MAGKWFEGGIVWQKFGSASTHVVGSNFAWYDGSHLTARSESTGLFVCGLLRVH